MFKINTIRCAITQRPTSRGVLKEFFAGLAICTILTAPLAASAQDRYPSKPIRIVLGFSAGGGTDAITRALAKNMGETLGANVIVDNKPGANGNIAGELVAKSPADGYTLLYNTSSIASSPALYGAKLTYNVTRDLTPIGRTASLPIVLVVPSDSPHKSAADLVKFLKANPKMLNYGSAGNGNVTHLAALSFEHAVGVQGTHVPYKGEAQALADLMAGHIQYYFATSPGAIPLVKGGRLKALAVATLKRLDTLPDVPTLNETVAKGLDLAAWSGLMAPAGTPPAVVAKLSGALNKALKDKSTLAYFATQSAEATMSSPEEYGTFLKKEMTALNKVIKDSGLTLE
jgi:tripartite-type tricarboxylate transporter receptor subunit TctC